VRINFCRLVLMAALIPPVGGVAGCSGPDDPKLAEAPKFTTPPDTGPPKIPGRKTAYGTSKRYQDSMQRQEQQGQVR
jgi:hypothetical protein